MAFSLRLEPSLVLHGGRYAANILSHSSRSFSLLPTNPSVSASLKSSSRSHFTIKASSASSITESESFRITSVPTKPYDGQKTGTSGLRKKVKVFMQENYLANWIQALFNSLPPEDYVNGLLVLGGDGRYFNKEAAQIIIKIAAANGVGKILVGRAIAVSLTRTYWLSAAVVSEIMCFFLFCGVDKSLSLQGWYYVYTGSFCSDPEAQGNPVHLSYSANGGFIMSASHNPGGPEYDWGIKFNYSSGQPAPESITDKIYGNTLSLSGLEPVKLMPELLQISEIKMANIPDIDLSRLGITKFGNFTVEVVDPVADYVELMENVFDFELIRSLLSRPDFRFTFDAMHAVTGAYAEPIFVDKLGAGLESISNGVPLEDFGHGHPDPNLTYAEDLLDLMYGENGPDFGAASDGDGDRNMILGRRFFVTPSDSVAIIAANAQEVIPYFRGGIKVPTGWKFFGNLMDAGRLSICGEESFGTGSDHIREKDGIWTFW
ncbi:hypothetical protein Cgig2_030019 [Carnegiea gigantea]|uniref:phosphoglucomutase (alpha-D-glucose-1,6-bisphosphate-dependent) n=1 Tax=Carnegiea gigantea TaxID=171969 RepID=A0A9Q1K749_9CARY|nr:hypothetical protein Cgig2_030019 [Carnegiea gigantea]